MIIIDLNGEIGWEIWPEEVRKQLAEAGSEDITVRWSTIGGNVFDGSDIMSLFIDHKRDNPGVKMYLEIKAVAASMGSAIAALDVWEEVGIDRTTAYMIHNPASFAFGDYREMLSMADFLTKMRVVYSGIYSDRSGDSESEVGELMDAETWFFGQSIIDAGFADKIITAADPGGDQIEPEVDDEKNEIVVIIDMKKKFQEMKMRQKELNTDGFDKSRAVACLTKPVMKTAVAEKNKPGQTGNLKTEVPAMTEEELKKDNPELYKALMSKGAEDNRVKNDERVKVLSEMKASEDYKDLPEVITVIDKAIMEGTAVEAVHPMISAAILKITKDPARMAAIESPADLGDGGNGSDKTKTVAKIREV